MPDSNITKNALAASMKKLMQGRPFSKISVGDICEACGMNRKSFYYHFRDKYDLVNWIFYVDFVSAIDLASYKNEWELLDELCRYFYAEREFYKKALEIEGQNSFREYFSETIQPVVNSFIKEMFVEDENREFYVNFFCDGFLAAMMRWLREGFSITPDEFLEKIHTIIFRLAQKVVEGANSLDDV